MTLRWLLLAGTVVPFAMCQPVLADAQSSGAVPWQLAQVDTVCPEGEECPPPETVPEEPALEGGQPEQVEPLPEELPEMEAAPVPEEVPQEVAPVPEEVPQEVAPVPEDLPLPETQGEPVPEELPQPDMEVAPVPEEAPLPETQVEPIPEEIPQPDVEVVPVPEELPQPDVEVAPIPEEVPQQEIEPQPEDAPQPQVEGTERPQDAPVPVMEEDTTVEQQLERQGDGEEAENVRDLREQLEEQLQDALGARPEDAPGAEGMPDRPEDRPRWWDRDDDQGEVVDRRGGRIIIDLGGGNIYVEPILPDEGGRLLYRADNVEVQNLRGGRTRTIVTRRNGVQIVTVRDRYGEIMTRIRILPDGTEIVLIDNRFPDDYAGGPPPILYDVPPPIIGIPQRQYIVDYGRASPEDIRGALLAPPVQQIQRPYTLNEVLRNEQVRAYSPRIDLDTITFEFGSATIGNDQMDALFTLGQALEQVLAEHPDEVYLIEGHTDKVGTNYANLILSDQRAEAVATALSQNFDIPPENLVTEGYGEEYPKVNTEEPERQNRRAAVRRVTELLHAQN